MLITGENKMSFLNDINDKIHETFDVANLKIATLSSLKSSETIKVRVREKMAKLSEENKKVDCYAALVDIHHEIEKNHDYIYARPNNGVSPTNAKEDCDKVLLAQEELENKFNQEYAKLTGDSSIFAENLALQADLKLRDAQDGAEQIKDDAVVKANEVADAAKEKAADTKQTLTDKTNDVIARVEDAVEDVKQDFTSPKPRP